ncbi:hypothetical protein [Mucilaginibacter sp. CSA2-8R]|uniref:hypothetical protein n=1 Tax=Mucilaginibacter sp. CSA2-8R TaxID=3141542 RepID=UPI00315DF7D7
MKTICRFAIISLLFIAGCRSDQNKSEQESSLKTIDDQVFKQEFKDLVMCHCVL